jgi:hypothetical protein
MTKPQLHYFITVLLLVLFTFVPASAQGLDGLSVNAGGGLHLPLSDYLSPGYRITAGVGYELAEMPLFAELSVGYDRFSGVDVFSDSSVSLIDAYLAAGYRFELFPGFSVLARGTIGYGYERLQTGGETFNGGALNWGADAGVAVPLGEAFDIQLLAGLRAQMNSHFAFESSLRVGFKPFALPPRQRVPRSGRSAESQPLTEASGTDLAGRLFLPPEIVTYDDNYLPIRAAGFSTVFPVFYRYYNEAPIGAIEIENVTGRGIENVEILVNIPAFMDLPQRQLQLREFPAGAIQAVDLRILFNNNLLEVTEGTQVAAQFIVRYDYLGTRYQYEVNTILEVANRNAMTWDDDRKAASFVTARDPVILSFAKSASAVSRTPAAASFPPALTGAMAVFQSLADFGIDYAVDPSSSYEALSETDQQIDFLQFPVQTLEYQAGDCDDLSILYAAMLEAVGIETAFVTIPGHIYLAVNSGVPDNQAERVFPDDRPLIFHDGSAWIPVEVTLLDEGFLRAWEIGGRNWNSYAADGSAALLPIAEAWETYAPVGFDTGLRGNIVQPDRDELKQVFTDELDRYRREVIDLESRPILAAIEDRGPGYRLYMRLAVVYARYGEYAAGREYIETALQYGETPAAYINLGNISLLEGDYRGAMAEYREAYALDAENPVLLKNLSIAALESGDADAAGRYFAELENIDPETAASISYVLDSSGDGTRASEAGNLYSLVTWEEIE